MTSSSSWPDGSIEARLIRALDSWHDTHPGETTSSITGTGAVAELETWFARRVGHLRGFAVASGTQALQGALLAAGATASSSVALPAYDWPAALAATLAIGATPIWCDVGPNGVITPMTVSQLERTPDVIVATDLHGYPVDILGVRAALPGVAIIEDCSQAIGAERGGRPAGSHADIAAWSLGHGKFIDAGEGGIITTSDETLAAALIATTHHPVRQLLAGTPASPLASVARIHPAAALLAVAEIKTVERRIREESDLHAQLVERAMGLGLGIPVSEPGVRLAPGLLIALEPEPQLVQGICVGECAYPDTTPSLVGQDSPEVSLEWARVGRRLVISAPAESACPRQVILRE